MHEASRRNNLRWFATRSRSFSSDAEPCETDYPEMNTLCNEDTRTTAWNPPSKNRPPNVANENPVNATQAAEQLGIGATMMSAVKKAMGISHTRYFFLSEVRCWLRAHPEFRVLSAYPARRPKRSNSRPGLPCASVGTSGAPSLTHDQ